ncbi:MAG: hypothetical protein MJK15_00750 [Colwellia sp.]|nr:hypothetical protein [Colwellia sp.]
MSKKINYVYKLAKKDELFRAQYDAVSSDEIEFPFFAGTIHKGILASIYYGYLIGTNQAETLKLLRHM